MRDLALIIFSGLAMIFLLLPIHSHLRARNSSTLIQVAWLLIANFITFVNCIVWADNTENHAPVWCDITIKLYSVAGSGLAGASFCINRRLANIAMARSASASHRQRRLSYALDASIGIVLPCILMVLAYVEQGHRFDIDEGYGCSEPVYGSVLSIFLVYWWPLVIGLLSSIYGVIAIRFFLRRRLQFQSLLRSSQSGLDSSHYLRLMAMASADLLIEVPLSIVFLVNAGRAVRPWPGWTAVHYGWSFVGQYTADDILSRGTVSVDLLSRWIYPMLAFIFFLFFGISEDAIGSYLQAVRRAYGLLPFVKAQSSSATGQLPPFIPTLGSTVVKPSGIDWAGSHHESTDKVYMSGTGGNGIGIGTGIGIGNGIGNDSGRGGSKHEEEQGIRSPPPFDSAQAFGPGVSIVVEREIV